MRKYVLNVPFGSLYSIVEYEKILGGKKTKGGKKRTFFPLGSSFFQVFTETVKLKVGPCLEM